MPYDYKGFFDEITLTHDLTTLPGDRKWRLRAPGRDTEHHEIVLYLGCNVLRTSHMVQTVTAIFDGLGLDYVAVGGPTYCCGIVHHQHGDAVAAGGMSRRTIEHIQRFGPRDVLMWCPSCIYFSSITCRCSRGRSGSSSRTNSRSIASGRTPSGSWPT